LPLSLKRTYQIQKLHPQSPLTVRQGFNYCRDVLVDL
jgi:hypothetical protein